MSQNSPVRVHLWGLDGRTLCDRFGSQRLPYGTQQGDRDIRPCGECVLAAEQYMAEAKGLIQRFGQPVPEPDEAVDGLEATRWSARVRLDELRGELVRIQYRYPVEPRVGSE